MTEETRVLHLPADLCRAAEERFAEKHGGLELFLAFVLRQLTNDDAQMDQAEQRMLEQRLKDLGYL